MEIPFEAEIVITSGRGKGAIINAWVMPNPNPNNQNKYTATPLDGSKFPGGNTYMPSTRFEFVK